MPKFSKKSQDKKDAEEMKKKAGPESDLPPWMQKKKGKKGK